MLPQLDIPVRYGHLSGSSDSIDCPESDHLSDGTPGPGNNDRCFLCYRNYLSAVNGQDNPVHAQDWLELAGFTRFSRV
jgi:hypothetical protein